MDILTFLDRHPVLGFLLALLMFGDTYLQCWMYLRRRAIRAAGSDQE